MLLQSIEFVTDRLFILNNFIMRNFKLLECHALVFALHVLMLISLKQLGLRRFVLLILRLKIAKLAIKLIQRILEILNLLDSVLSFVISSQNSVLLLLKHIRNGSNSVFIIFGLGMKHVESLLLGVDVLV